MKTYSVLHWAIVDYYAIEIDLCIDYAIDYAVRKPV